MTGAAETPAVISAGAEIEMTVDGHVSWMVTAKLIDGAGVLCCGVELAVRVMVVEVPLNAAFVVETRICKGDWLTVTPYEFAETEYVRGQRLAMP